MRSAPSRSKVFCDDFLHRYSGDVWFSTSQQVSGQLLVAIIIIVAVTVCETRTRFSPSTVPFNIYNFRSDAIRSKVAISKEIARNRTRRQAIYSSRWSAFSLDHILYNQQLDVVVVQCNQHHREKRHRGSALFSTLYKPIANNNTYLLNVVDYNFIVGIIRIINHKKILVESIIFAYLISLDLYS